MTSIASSYCLQCLQYDGVTQDLYTNRCKLAMRNRRYTEGTSGASKSERIEKQFSGFSRRKGVSDECGAEPVTINVGIFARPCVAFGKVMHDTRCLFAIQCSL